MDNLPDVRGGKLYYPNILFQMSYRTETKYKPDDFGGYPPAESASTPTQEEFFEVWDAIVQSIRPYPGAFTPAPVEPPKEPLRSPSAQQRSGDRQELDDFLGEG